MNFVSSVFVLMWERKDLTFLSSVPSVLFFAVRLSLVVSFREFDTLIRNNPTCGHKFIQCHPSKIISILIITTYMFSGTTAKVAKLTLPLPISHLCENYLPLPNSHLCEIHMCTCIHFNGDISLLAWLNITKQNGQCHGRNVLLHF